MPASEKILWVVHYESLDAFVKKAAEAGITGVAIRTDNDVPAAIAKFHAKGIKVYGWRWPSARRDSCMAEAKNVVALLQQGLDGYFVDPEGEPGKPYDWNRDGLDDLARDFCKAITSAAPGKPFGTTSHYRAKALFRKLPWAAFLGFSTVLLPQAYWKVTGGNVGHGDPKENYEVALDRWEAAGGDRAKIVPMAGELAKVSASDIAAYAATAVANNVKTLHFYDYNDNVKQAVWDAIARA
ncbi:MAG TPA: hypothetical protein VG986_02325 [Pseudolabrys sp.]|nr:hypothetical protein [Pseudolabrys sp.]